MERASFEHRISLVIIFTNLSFTSSQQQFSLDLDSDVLGGSVLFAIDGPEWAKRRKLLSSHFSIASQKSFFDAVFACAIESCERLEKEYCDTDKIIELDPFLKTITCEIICQILFGHKLSNIEQINNFYLEACDEIFFASAIPLYRWMPIPKRIKYFFQRREFRKMLEQEVLKAEEDSIAGILYRNKDLSMNELVNELTGLVFAGFETTSATVSACLGVYLYDDKESHAELRKSLDEELPDNIKDWTLFDVKNNKVADRILKETLRIHPPATSHPVTAVKDMEGEKTRDFFVCCT